jgi:glycosyltransferase involved in cell wall biosynthesis
VQLKFQNGGLAVKVAAIIPAYNESKTVGGVIEVLTRCRMIDQIVVVSDGSTDRTVQTALAYKDVEVIELLENRGKGGAIYAGKEQTDAEILLFMDADLIGLSDYHVTSLLQPVLSGAAAMTVGIFENGRVATDIAQKMAPFLSGQRALRRELLEQIPYFEFSRFGAEIALHRYVADNNIPVRQVALPDLSHVMKEEKLGLCKGIFARGKMYWEIAKYAIRVNPTK